MVINTYDQLRQAVKDGLIETKQAIMVYYAPYEARGGQGSCWMVASPFFETDPQSTWYYHGKKAFIVAGRSSMGRKRQEAIEWATKVYGVKEWKRNRVRDYVPAIVQEKLPIPKRER